MCYNVRFLFSNLSIKFIQYSHAQRSTALNFIIIQQMANTKRIGNFGVGFGTFNSKINMFFLLIYRMNNTTTPQLCFDEGIFLIGNMPSLPSTFISYVLVHP